MLALIPGPGVRAQNGMRIEDAAKLAERWEAAATAAETRVANPLSSTASLEAVRSTMAALRAETEALRDAAQARMQPLRAQMEALGPAPADGVVEAPEISDQRRRLSDQIAAADVPVKTAETAFRRANAIIGSIDGLIRNRFKDELLTQQPAPVSPSDWVAAAGEIRERSEAAVFDALTGTGQAGSHIWVGLLSGLLGLLLLVGVRHRVIGWFERRLSPALPGGATGGGGGTEGRNRVWTEAGLTLVAFAVPAIGAGFLLLGVRQAGLMNGAAAPYLRDASYLAFVLVTAYWLAQTLFGVDGPARALMPMTPRKARAAGRTCVLLGLIAGVDRVLVSGDAAVWMSLQTLAIQNLILICLGSLALYRLGAALRAETAASPAEGDREGEEPAEPRTNVALGQAVRTAAVRVAQGVSVAAPLLALAGFYAGSRFVFYPVVLSGAVFGACIVLVALVQHGVDVALTGTDGRRQERSSLRLLPILSGFGLACIVIPLLALIWGARESDLGNAWAVVTGGISLGETQVRPIDFATFALIFAVGYSLTGLVQSLLKGTVLPQTRLDPGGRMAVVSMVGYLGVVVSALAAVSATGLDLSSLAIVAGALSVGIGFGLQNVVSNFVSGLILLIERPVKEGDWIEVGGFEGTVKRISVRATSVQTFDRAIVIVPNADLITTAVLNRTHSSTTGRIIVPVGVAYGTDTRKVERVLDEIGRANSLLIKRPAPFVYFKGFGPTAMEFEIRGFLRDINLILEATTEINHAIAVQFRAEGIDIPYTHSDIRLLNAAEIAGLLRAGVAEAAKGTAADLPANGPA